MMDRHQTPDSSKPINVKTLQTYESKFIAGSSGKHNQEEVLFASFQRK